MSKKILVTGVAGFMGSHLAELLAKEGHEVYGFDNLSIGREFNIPKEITFIKCDLRNQDETEKYIKDIKPSLVYHLAAWAQEGLSQFMPRLITENNYNAFLNLIIPCINSGMERIVVASSMSVYGAQKPPFSEDMPLAPEDVYAVSKAAMEKTTEILADVHGFDYTIIRPHNVYGPRQPLWDPYRNVVAIFINRLMKGLPPVVYGDGNQTRSFTYIDDFNPYIAKAGFIEEAKGETFNIGPVEEHTINELAEIVLKAFGSDLKAVHTGPRPREVKESFCTNDKAKKLLGYETSTTLEEGVRKMVEWAKSLGPQEFQYLPEMELTGKNIPETWLKKTL